MIKMLFQFLFADPEVGETYVWRWDKGDPWNILTWTILERRGKWYRAVSPSGMEQTFTKNTLKTFYSKI